MAALGPVAEYSGPEIRGTITVEEWEAFLLHGRPGSPKASAAPPAFEVPAEVPAGSNLPATPTRALEQLILLEILEQQAVEKRLGEKAFSAAQLALARDQILSRALKAQLREETRPAPTEVRRFYETHEATFSRPRRWQLLHAFRRWPEGAAEFSPEERGEAARALTQDLADLRARTLAGDDFSALAQQRSDSTSRFFGGRTGFSSLDQLHPKVAPAVAKLSAGDLSPVIETEDGFHLLYCLQVLDPKRKTFEEVEDRIEDHLWAQALATAQQVLRDQAFEAGQPSFQARALRSPSLEAAAVTYRPLGDRDPEDAPASLLTLNQTDIRALLGERRRAKPPRPPSPEETQQALKDRFWLRAQGLEAQRRGLDFQHEVAERLAWRRRESLASLAARDRVNEILVTPTPDEVSAEAARTKGHSAATPSAERVHLQWVEIVLDAQIDRSLYSRLEAAARQVQADELPLEELPAHLDPTLEAAVFYPPRWMSELQVATLGKTVAGVVASLEPGDVSSLLQDGDRLRLIELLDRQGAAPLSPEQLRSRAEATLLRQRRLAARRAWEGVTFQALSVRPGGP